MTISQPFRSCRAALPLGLLFLPAVSTAQHVVVGKEDYLIPPPQIAAILTSDALYNRVLVTGLAPNREHFLVPKSDGMPGLDRLARPYVNLGEVAIDHRAQRSRSLSTRNTIGYDLISYKTGARIEVRLEDGMTVSGETLAPDGSKLAFLGHGDEATYLYMVDLQTGRPERVTEQPVLATLVSTIRWTWDSKRVLTVLRRENAGDLPQAQETAREPSVWVTHDGKTPTRTYRFLLKSPHDKELLEYLVTGQLTLVDVDTGKRTPIGKPSMFTSIDIDPTGQYCRVTTVQKPFSYFVPLRSFGTRDEIWDRTGKAVALIREQKLRLGSSGDPAAAARAREAQNLRRNLAWRPDGRGLSFLQREPAKKKTPTTGQGKGVGAATGKGPGKVTDKGAGGAAPQADPAAVAKPDEATKPKRKDRIVHWAPPYGEANAKVLWESDDPIENVAYSKNCTTLFVTQTVKGKRRIFAVHLREPKKQLKVLETDAGASATSGARRRFGRRGGGSQPTLHTARGPRGGRFVRQSIDRKAVFVSGIDRPKDPAVEAPRPYVDRVVIGTGEKKRVWQSPKEVYETLVTPIDDEFGKVIVNREGPNEVPNSYLLEPATGKRTRITDNVDPAPTITAARRLRIKCKRVDGFEFWTQVTVPRNYGARLPALFWFYPREFASQKAYDEGQKNYNKNRFPTIRSRSMELLTTLGYVVVQPDCPIVGEQNRMNDNFIGDLRNSLWAVIDELDKRQLIDRNRLAIGGHSYGAFGTANALIHTPFFKAGIAGDGNYNRTLTPMSFQSERRNLWEARETYFRMSPLLWANQLNGALLMYHGADDTNTGTFPINSPRMFQALDGLGKKAALYMYPYEGHGPIARETILDLWARWVEWLDIHVRNPERANVKPKPAKGKSLTETRGK